MLAVAGEFVESTAANPNRSDAGVAVPTKGESHDPLRTFWFSDPTRENAVTVALITCPACKGSVSTEATACPKCGHRFPREVSTQSPIVVVGALLLMIFLVFFLKVF